MKKILSYHQMQAWKTFYQIEPKNQMYAAKKSGLSH